MAHIFQLRRGTRYVDEKGNTLLNDDDTPVRDDWATYTARENHRKPLEGELVVEFEQFYNPATGTLGKKLPRFKLGDGDNEFADLEYISPDSFVLPTRSTVDIAPDNWLRVDCDGNIIDLSGNIVGVDGSIAEEGYYELDEEGNIIDPDGKLVENRYVQFVNVANATITPKSKVDLQLSPEDLIIFSEKNHTFTTINAGGQVRVCVVGQKPTNSYTFNVTVTEVVLNE